MHFDKRFPLTTRLHEITYYFWILWFTVKTFAQLKIDYQV